MLKIHASFPGLCIRRRFLETMSYEYDGSKVAEQPDGNFGSLFNFSIAEIE